MTYAREFEPVSDTTLPPGSRKGGTTGFLPDDKAAMRRADKTGWGTSCYSITEAQLDRLRRGDLLYLNDGEYVTLIRLVPTEGAT